MAKDFESFPLIDFEPDGSPCAPYFTFSIPDLSVYPADFRKFVEKDLIENSTLIALESSQRLNWWASAQICPKLWPLSTTGDGNCLLHAASLAMWGFHDRKLTLRTALHNILSNGECRDALWRRWRFHQTKLNKQAAFVYTDYEWAKEWDEIVAMASPEPRNQSDEPQATRRRSFVLDSTLSVANTGGKKNVTYESLEEIHILALAHVLRRPIIVVADTMLRDMNGEAMAPINFNGIYLPFEIPADECHQSPLMLTYDTAHFSALVPMDSANEFPPALVPLVDCENKLLPVQFCIDPGESFDWRNYDGGSASGAGDVNDVWQLSEYEHISLLREYLSVIYALNPSSPDDEIYEDYWTDEEIDGVNRAKFADSEVVLSDEAEQDNQKGNNRKASKQLQQVAKQFGSIGKNVSKKIKKNFGSITSNFKQGQASSSFGGKKGGSGGSGGSFRAGSIGTSGVNRISKVLCAELKSKRHPYQQEMINNYLECAQLRYQEVNGGEPTAAVVTPGSSSNKSSEESGQSVGGGGGDNLVQPQTVALTNTPTSLTDTIVHCINTGCQNFGTSKTSYMCEECFERQRRQEEQEFIREPSVVRYGTLGNSRFYTQADGEAHRQIQNLPPVKRLNELDQTLYLSNSTFFNDKLAGSPSPRGTTTVERVNSNKVINHKILVEGLDYNHPIPFQQQSPLDQRREQEVALHPVPPPRRESQQPSSSQRNAIYLGDRQAADRVVSEPGLRYSQGQPCKTVGCSFFGHPGNSNYCSKCRPSFGQSSKILTDV